MLVVVDLDQEGVVGAEVGLRVVVFVEEGERAAQLQLDLVAVLVFLVLLTAQDLPQHVYPFLEALEGQVELAQVQVGQPHHVEHFRHYRVLLLVLEGHYRHLLLHELQGGRRVLELPLALRDVDDGLDGLGVVLGVVLGVGEVLLLQVVDGGAGGGERVGGFFDLG